MKENMFCTFVLLYKSYTQLETCSKSQNKNLRILVCLLITTGFYFLFSLFHSNFSSIFIFHFYSLIFFFYLSLYFCIPFYSSPVAQTFLHQTLIRFSLFSIPTFCIPLSLLTYYFPMSALLFPSVFSTTFALHFLNSPFYLHFHNVLVN